MSLLFNSYLIINVLLLLILIGQTRARVFGRLANSAVNPLLAFCILTVLFNVDFVIVWNYPHLDFLERVSWVSSVTVLDAYGTYTCIFAGASFGLFTAVAWWSRRATQPIAVAAPDHASVLSAQIVFWAILAVAAPVLIWLSATRDEELSGQMFAREHPIFIILFFAVPAAAALFAAHRPISASTFVGLGLAAALLAGSGGARNPVLMILLVIGVMYALSSPGRLSSLWYLVVVPGSVVFLTLSRYIFRTRSGVYDSFTDFLDTQGGLLAAFFGSEEISFGKLFSVVYEIVPALPRAPFESFIALLLYPLPREIFPLKPFGASTAFTQFISPVRWEYSQSESLVTGYGDLYWQFGVLGAILGAFVLAVVWLSLCFMVLRKSTRATIMWLPLLIWSMLIFVRNDVFNLGLFLWPAAFVMVLHRMLQPICHLISRHDMELAMRRSL